MLGSAAQNNHIIDWTKKIVCSLLKNSLKDIDWSNIMMGPRKRITVRRRGIREAASNPCNRRPNSCQMDVCKKLKI